MKLGVIFFHKNIAKIYKDRWIKKCVDSILNQSVKEFSIYEINYGGDDYSVLEGFEFQNPHYFSSMELQNHAEAMNIIIDYAFGDGCDFVFNTNLDDYYRTDRIELQSSMMREGFDIVSSDFCYIEEKGEDDIITFHKKILQFGPIEKNLYENHNVIAHPAVCFSRKFWEKNRYFPSEIPMEDLLLWKRGISNGYKFYIHPDELLFYRLHQNQITGNNVKTNIDPNGPGMAINLRDIRYNF